VAAGSVSGDRKGDRATPLPRNIGRPATDALTLAGYDSLERLDGASPKALLRLHGVGPVAIARLREALAADGRSMRD
jgi:DNA repair protein RadC